MRLGCGRSRREREGLDGIVREEVGTVEECVGDDSLGRGREDSAEEGDMVDSTVKEEAWT